MPIIGGETGKIATVGPPSSNCPSLAPQHRE
jgi:hypothetical protein